MDINLFHAREVKILKYSQLTSTNDLAKELIQNKKAEEGMLIWADVQTAGRGQLDSKWVSNKEENILCALILCPVFLEIDKQPYLNMAMALAICNAIKKFSNAAKIKWPNDIWIGNKKVAGILIENILQGNKLKYVVVGFGINVNQSEDLPENATSLRLQTNTIIDRQILIHEILNQIEKYYAKLFLKKMESLFSEYHANLFGLGEFRNFNTESETFTALVKGVNEQGELLLVKDESTLKFQIKQIKWL